MISRREGNGPRLFVGLHGWAGTMAAYEPLLAHLPPDVTLVRFDMPGCGRSPRPGRFDLEAIADETAAAIAAEIGQSRQPAQSLTLVGNCSGALFALLAGRDLGGRGLGRRVERVVLVDPFAFLPAYFRIFTAPVWGRYAYGVTFANPIGRWITNAGLARRRSGGTNLTSFFERTDHEANRMYMEMFARTDSPCGASGGSRAVLEGLRGWSVPMDIAYGSKTFGAVKRSIPIWRDVFPQARVSEVPGAGHLPIRDAPGALARIIFGAPVASAGAGPDAGSGTA